MGAAAGKQFQSEKAKHAQAVLSAVEMFEESNQDEQDSYGGVSTEFFKKKVMMAASDAKRKGKDIEKSLAQLTDADLDMLANYVENRKAEERRKAAESSNSMRVEEIIDDGVDGAEAGDGNDNVDETTSVLSYGDDEEEAVENDELDSSEEVLENIEEVAEEVETRPRLNSGFKVFPEPGAETMLADGNKGNLKLEEATVRPGVAEHFAKFWELDDPGSLASMATHGGSRDSPLTAALSPSSTQIGKKFQPSPKQSFPYKDRGQRIDEGNEALMVLQRQKVISLTQNAQLEREVEALQRQLEKMDQIEQSFESTGRSTQSSFNNTGASSVSVGSSSVSKYAQKSESAGFGNSSGGGGAISRYSYIYPIDEEAASPHIQHEPNHRRNNEYKASGGGGMSVGGSVVTGPGRRMRRDRAAKGGSSPSSSDNDSVNSFSNNNSNNNSINNSNNNNNAAFIRNGVVGNNKARVPGKGLAIARTRSNDQSDDDQPQPVSSLRGRGISTNSNNNNSSSVSGSTAVRPRRVRVGGIMGNSNNDGDSDDSAHIGSGFNGRHGAGAGGYNPSHPSLRKGFNNNNNNFDSATADTAAQAKHAESDSDANTQDASNHRFKSQVPRNKRVVGGGASVRTSGTQNIEDQDAKLHDDAVNKIGLSPSQMNARRMAPTSVTGITGISADAKKTPSPSRIQREALSKGADAPEYKALMENVSMHLEAVRKDTSSASIHSGPTSAAVVVGGGGGSGKIPIRNRNANGGALKKLNKRRHSMDGLGENHNANVSNTDTSQDEAEGSPSSKFKRFGKKLAGAEGVVRHSPPRTHIPGGDSYVTTDDESIGGAAGPRTKLRRPRAKATAVGPASSGAGAGASGGGADFSPREAIAAAVGAGTAANGNSKLTPATGDTTSASATTDVVGGGSSEAASSKKDIADVAAEESDASASGAASGARGKRKVRGSSKSNKIPSASNSVEALTQAASPWDNQLDQWWGEVSLLLRKPILQEEDMLYTVAAAEAGLIYTEEMNSVAQSLNVLRGALSRWILPYDNNTRIESQCSTPHSVVENMPDEFRGKLTERQVHYLVAGANGVRKLIRVKIADDNDLEQARKALKSTDMFFKALYHRAGQANITPYQLLKMADTFH